eukprot:TRINITY_DN1391_c0_g1_i2.p1 TRINITY_DN1391_c0_g1~~TRINITY_DN1391_c0_g1_i2.p1  ORF type:complete len:554 (-),score=251.12 TRINITY_DN1391_c0_g1_i2:136-1797(-)
MGSKVKLWTKDGAGAWIDKGVLGYTATPTALILAGTGSWTFVYKSITGLSFPSPKRLKFSLNTGGTEYLLQFQNEQAAGAIQDQINEQQSSKDESMEVDDSSSVSRKSIREDEDGEEEEDDEEQSETSTRRSLGRKIEDDEEEKGSGEDDEEEKSERAEKEEGDEEEEENEEEDEEEGDEDDEEERPKKKQPQWKNANPLLAPAAPFGGLSPFGSITPIGAQPSMQQPFFSPTPLLAPTAPQYAWSWKADHGWVDYSADLNTQLSNAVLTGTTNVRVDSERFVDVENMLQRRYDDVNRRRQVRKQPIASPSLLGATKSNQNSLFHSLPNPQPMSMSPFSFGATNNNHSMLGSHSFNSKPQVIDISNDEEAKASSAAASEYKEEEQKRRKREEEERKEREKENKARGSEKEEREKRMNQREEEREKLIKSSAVSKNLVNTVLKIEDALKMVSSEKDQEFNTRLPEDDFDDTWGYGYKMDVEKPKQEEKKPAAEEKKVEKKSEEKKVEKKVEKKDEKKSSGSSTPSTSSKSSGAGETPSGTPKRKLMKKKSTKDN